MANMKLRTKIISTLIVIIILLTIPPFIDGYYFKNSYQNMIAAINRSLEESGGDIQIKIVDYRLGIFHSTAKLQITTTDKEFAKLFADGITIEDQISHGPIVRDAHTGSYTLAYATTATQVYLPASISSVIFGKNAQIPFIQARTNISLRGVWDQQLKISPLTLPQLGSFAFQDSQSQSIYQVDQNSIQDSKTTSTIGAISFQGNNPYLSSVMIQPMTYTQTLNKSGKGIWNSNSQLTAPAIQVKWLNGREMLMNQLQLSTNKGINAQGLYDSTFKMMLNGMTLTDSEILPLTASSATIAIRDLNPDGLNEYLNYFKQHQALESKDEVAALQELSKKLLTPTTRVEISLNANTKEGLLKLDSALGYQSAATQSASLPEIVQNLSTTTIINISQPILHRLFMQVISMMTATNNALNGSIDMESSNVKLNPFQIQVAQLSQSGQITLNQSLQLLELSSQRLTPELFNAKATEISSADIASQLNQAYQQYLTLPASVDNSSDGQEMTVGEKADALINEWIKQGYLVPTSTGFTSKMVYTNHQWQLNDKPVADITVALTPPKPVLKTTVSGTSVPLLTAPTDTLPPPAVQGADTGASTDSTGQAADEGEASESSEAAIDETTSSSDEQSISSETTESTSESTSE